MSKRMFTILISIAIPLGLILMVFLFTMGVQNKAINLEEQINESASAIEVQEKRRVDLIYNLVDTVQAYDDHEKETLTQLTEARTQASEGNIEQAELTIQAVAEAYPDLKSSTNYQSLMTELATTENLIAEHRNNYNLQVKAYNKYTRVFPSGTILNLLGYEKIDVDYLEYEAPSDAPTDLFKEE